MQNLYSAIMPLGGYRGQVLRHFAHNLFSSQLDIVHSIWK